MWPVETIIQGVNGVAHQIERRTFSAISTDSRTIAPGEFFIPLKGPFFDGHVFIDEAYGRSGGGSLCDRTRQEVYALARGTVILVDDTNKALLDLASHKRGQTGRICRHNREQRQDHDQGAARSSREAALSRLSPTKRATTIR